MLTEIDHAINIRINTLSSSKNISNNHKGFYNEVIHNIGYKNELKHLKAKIHHNDRDDNFGSNRTNKNINKQKY